MSASLELPPEVIGPVPQGQRVNVYVTGGEIEGPRLRAKLRPVGADWLTLHADGIAILDARVTIESHGGALIYAFFGGVIDLGAEGYRQFLAGDLPRDGTPIRTTSRFQTAHPDYAWLNRLQAVGIGETLLSEAKVRYDLYAVR